jgi:hypothetical protein
MALNKFKGTNIGLGDSLAAFVKIAVKFRIAIFKKAFPESKHRASSAMMREDESGM